MLALSEKKQDVYIYSFASSLQIFSCILVTIIPTCQSLMLCMSTKNAVNCILFLIVIYKNNFHALCYHVFCDT